MASPDLCNVEVYIGWANSVLHEDGFTVGTLEDFKKGNVIGQLIDLLDPNAQIQNKIEASGNHSLENSIQTVLDYLTEKGVKLTKPSTEILSEDEKPLLELVWAIILNFSLHSPGRSAYQRTQSISRRLLIDWCKQRLPNEEFDNRQSLNQNLCRNQVLVQLISQACPVDFSEDELSWLTDAILVAEEHLGISKHIINPADVYDGSVDETALLIYVALLRRKMNLQQGSLTENSFTEEQESSRSFRTSLSPQKVTSSPIKLLLEQQARSQVAMEALEQQLDNFNALRLESVKAFNQQCKSVSSESGCGTSIQTGQHAGSDKATVVSGTNDMHVDSDGGTTDTEVADTLGYHKLNPQEQCDNGLSADEITVQDALHGLKLENLNDSIDDLDLGNLEHSDEQSDVIVTARSDMSSDWLSSSTDTLPALPNGAGDTHNPPLSSNGANNVDKQDVEHEVKEIDTKGTDMTANGISNQHTDVLVSVLNTNTSLNNASVHHSMNPTSDLSTPVKSVPSLILASPGSDELLVLLDNIGKEGEVLKAELNRAHEREDELKQALEELQISDMRDDIIEKLSQDLERQRTENRQLFKESAGAEVRYRQSQQMVAKLQSAIANLNLDVERLKEENSTKNASVANLKQHIETMEKDKPASSLQFTGNVHNCHSVGTQTEQDEEKSYTVTDLTFDEKTLDPSDSLTLSSIKLQTNPLELQRSLASATLENEILQAKVTKANSEMARKVSEISTVLDETRQELNNTLKEKQQLKLSAETYHLKIKGLEAQVKTLENSAKSAQLDNDKLNEQLNEALATLRNQLKGPIPIAANTEIENSQLKDKMEALEMERNKLRQELSWAHHEKKQNDSTMQEMETTLLGMRSEKKLLLTELGVVKDNFDYLKQDMEIVQNHFHQRSNGLDYRSSLASIPKLKMASSVSQRAKPSAIPEKSDILKSLEQDLGNPASLSKWSTSSPKQNHLSVNGHSNAVYTASTRKHDTGSPLPDDSAIDRVVLSTPVMTLSPTKPITQGERLNKHAEGQLHDAPSPIATDGKSSRTSYTHQIPSTDPLLFSPTRAKYPHRKNDGIAHQKINKVCEREKVTLNSSQTVGSGKSPRSHAVMGTYPSQLNERSNFHRSGIVGLNKDVRGDGLPVTVSKNYLPLNGSPNAVQDANYAKGDTSLAKPKIPANREEMRSRLFDVKVSMPRSLDWSVSGKTINRDFFQSRTKDTHNKSDTTKEDYTYRRLHLEDLERKDNEMELSDYFKKYGLVDNVSTNLRVKEMNGRDTTIIKDSPLKVTDLGKYGKEHEIPQLTSTREHQRPSNTSNMKPRGHEEKRDSPLKLTDLASPQPAVRPDSVRSVRFSFEETSPSRYVPSFSSLQSEQHTQTTDAFARKYYAERTGFKKGVNMLGSNTTLGIPKDYTLKNEPKDFHNYNPLSVQTKSETLVPRLNPPNHKMYSPSMGFADSTGVNRSQGSPNKGVVRNLSSEFEEPKPSSGNKLSPSQQRYADELVAKYTGKYPEKSPVKEYLKSSATENIPIKPDIISNALNVGDPLNYKKLPTTYSTSTNSLPALHETAASPTPNRYETSEYHSQPSPWKKDHYSKTDYEVQEFADTDSNFSEPNTAERAAIAPLPEPVRRRCLQSSPSESEYSQPDADPHGDHIPFTEQWGGSRSYTGLGMPSADHLDFYSRLEAL